jgi:hypothetical protein
MKDSESVDLMRAAVISWTTAAEAVSGSTGKSSAIESKRPRSYVAFGRAIIGPLGEETPRVFSPTSRRTIPFGPFAPHKDYSNVVIAVCRLAAGL